jgi:hypothetical protein
VPVICDVEAACPQRYVLPKATPTIVVSRKITARFITHLV